MITTLLKRVFYGHLKRQEIFCKQTYKSIVTYIIFCDMLSKASYHDCVVWWLTFVSNYFRSTSPNESSIQAAFTVKIIIHYKSHCLIKRLSHSVKPIPITVSVIFSMSFPFPGFSFFPFPSRTITPRSSSGFVSVSVSLSASVSISVESVSIPVAISIWTTCSAFSIFIYVIAVIIAVVSITVFMVI